VVDLNEDGAAELDGAGRVVPYVDGGGAPADVGVALKDGDGRRDRGFGGVLREVVGCGGAAGAGA
jgi:hypothetical protein